MQDLDMRMKEEQIFGKFPGALALFDMVDVWMREQFPTATKRVQKSQVAYWGEKAICYLTPPYRQMVKGRKKDYIVLTFGLHHPLEHPRIAQISQPYPNRFTHHSIVTGSQDLNEELRGWLLLAIQARKKD